MPKESKGITAIPPQAKNLLKRVGENIERARRHRRITRQAFADRLYVSVPTVRRLEQGHPGVSLGVLASALWALGLHNDLSRLAAAESDLIGQALWRRAQGGPDNDF
ncbi:MAG: helix-turn-helix domain-containing protein [Myxococcota bacterium]